MSVSLSMRGRTLVIIFALLGTVVPVQAQNPVPPQAQIPAGLTGPGLRSLLQARIRSGGITPDQIRQELTRRGYDPGMLDPYLDETIATPPDPSDQILTAMRGIGVLEVPQADSTAGLARPPEVPVMQDTVGRELPPASAQEKRLGLRVFGLDVFARGTTQFQPLTSGPVPGSYVIGPGDELVLVITGDVEYSYTLPVTREGFIIIPQVGQVWVNGLTLERLRDQLYTHLGRVYSGVRRGAGASTRFDVSLGRLRSNQVFVTGEVVQPGTYIVSSLASLLNALYLAGGPTPNGSFRNVQVVRGGETVHDVDLYEYLLAGNNLESIRLEPGDVVFVPVHGAHVAITGEVVRPAIYELKPGETLAHLIAAAGGTTAPASLRRARITRVLPPSERTTPGLDRSTIDVSLAEVVANPALAPVLGDGDEVRIFAIREEVRNTVTLNGSVWQEGTYAYRPGMRAWDLIGLAEGLSPDAYISRATITRLNPADSTLSVIPFTLARDADGTPQDNPELSEFDVIEIYSQSSATEELPLTILGEVHAPAETVFKEGMTLRDLIIGAGGLKPTADLSIEVARLASGYARTGGQMAHQYIIEADSSYFISDQSARYYFGDRAALEQVVGGGAAANFRLMPYDRVIVRRLPEFELHRTVLIRGEVMQPGAYSLLRKDERLAALISRTGGLTPSAFADGFQFFRNGVRVNVDLARALRNTRSEDNILLLPGDSMLIPEYSPVVIVQGAVNSPGAVLFEEGRDLDYYIESAGGYARNADEKRVQVRYANGQGRVRKRGALFFMSDPEPGPGSVVTVSAVDPAERPDVRGIVADIAQIVGTVATVLILAFR